MMLFDIVIEHEHIFAMHVSASIYIVIFYAQIVLKAVGKFEAYRLEVEERGIEKRVRTYVLSYNNYVL